MVGVEHQGLALASEHGRIHAVHIVHLHHVPHPSAFLGHRDHGSHLVVLQLLHLDLHLVIAQSFLEGLRQLLRIRLEALLILLLNFLLEGVRHVGVNAHEL